MYLSFSVQLISLSMIISRSFHISANGIISFIFFNLTSEEISNNHKTIFTIVLSLFHKKTNFTLDTQMTPP